jgi:hypothetical protein
MYFGEDTGDGLFYYPEEDWYSDRPALKLIDYWGERHINNDNVFSKYHGQRNVGTPIGQFRCHHFSVVLKHSNYKFQSCIAPGVGEVWKQETFPNGRNISYILAAT